MQLQHDLSKVKLTEKLGEGAYGVVYKGFNSAAGQSQCVLPNVLAVKVVQVSILSLDGSDKTKEQIMRKLAKECDLLRKLKNHPNVIKYYGFLEDKEKEQASIFMEYMPCGTLQSLYKEFGKFEELMVKRFAKQILNALSYTHKNNIIHGDVKAANILFDGSEIKLSDFGESMGECFSQDPGENSHIMSDEINGSIKWMAPELFLQKGRGRRSDIWSLGCTLIELLTGQNPWPEASKVQQVYDNVLNNRSPKLPENIS